MNKIRFASAAAAFAVFIAGIRISFAEPQTDEAAEDAAQTEQSGTGSSGYATLTTDLSYAQNITPAPEAGYLDKEIYTESDTLTPPDLSYAEAALLMDADSGRVLYGKNANKKMYPASTTKIITGIVALELCVEKGYGMDTVIEAQPEAILPITSEDSHMGILIGEHLSIENLLYGLLVNSANDAANVLAVELAGSMNDFVDLMNKKAGEIGMRGTHFSNVCGLHDDDHYTTAYDLSVAARYAMQNETFREIVKTPMYNMPSTDKYKYERNLSNTNLFLSKYRSSYYSDPDHYIGVKTGHTEKAGYCLVTAARHTPDDDENSDQVNLISVVMNCPDKDVNERAYSYVDTRKLINFGFNNYRYISIHKAGEQLADSAVTDAKNNARVNITTDSDVYAFLPKTVKTEDLDIKTDITKELEAPIHAGDTLGTAVFSYGGNTIANVNLMAMNEVEQNIPVHIYHKVRDVLIHPAVLITAGVLLILILILYSIKRANERKRRLRRLKNAQRKAAPQKKNTPVRKPKNHQAANQRNNGNSMYTKKK